MSARSPVLLVAVVLVALAGCGDAAEPRAGAEECLANWNGDDVALTVGGHSYDDHGVRRALVERIAAPAARNVRGETTCVVVFAVEEGDAEFGQLGLVVTRFGWSQLLELGLEDEALADLQRSASVEANATLLPDGKLSLD